jgi:ubiquinone/menaquinone biosynthesis C-methylase UbiE
LKSPSIVEANKNKTKAGLEDLEFMQMDYSDLKFPDNYFDGVFTIETLVHSLDYKRTLSEFLRVLKPGGVLVNYEYSMDEKMDPKVEEVWQFIYKEGSMHTLDAFRFNKMHSNWDEIGFVDVKVKDISEYIRPFMSRLYQIAVIPYYVLKIFGKEKQHLNTYVAISSYKKDQRKTFHYTVVKATKPRQATIDN